MKRHARNDSRRTLRSVLTWSVLGLLFFLGATLLVLSIWYRANYNLTFKELLYTLVSPLKGTGEGTVSFLLSSCLPWILVLMGVFVTAAVLLARRPTRHYVLYRRIFAGATAVAFLGSVVFSLFAFKIPAYIKGLYAETEIYEQFYVDPNTVSITADGKTKNLICIYLESMETTYASVEQGGAQPEHNYIPNLTALANQGVSFSEKGEGLLGGVHTVNGATWTIAALFSTTSGIPFSFPAWDVAQNTSDEMFAFNITTLGDILEERGYKQEFLCGSDSSFGGRRSFFTQHGGYEIFDLFTAREEGYIPEDYAVWWGYEDYRLYEIAKNELTELAASDQPFNFTMLTVDTHHVDGYYCDVCVDTYKDNLGNVLNCADRLLYDFVLWCQAQDFYEDSVIVILGDHPRMDTTFVDGVEYFDRTVYNCFLNAAVEVSGRNTEREATVLDMFPTILAAMGFSVEGDRLGLGVNLFSERPTMAEVHGFDWFNDELDKSSSYYMENFP